MKAHWATLLIGLLFISLIAAARPVRRPHIELIRPLHTASERPTPAAETEEAAVEEPVQESAPEVRQPLNRTLGESELSMIKTWDEWKDQSIAALPPDLREDSDHRNAIENHHASAVRAILGYELHDVGGRFRMEFEGPRVELTAYTEAQASADLLERDLLSSFPFTGEQGDALHLLIQNWETWKEQALQALPEELREDSAQKKAIEDYFRSAIRYFQPGLMEVVSIINRPPVGEGDIGGVGFTNIKIVGVEVVEFAYLSDPGGEETFLEADE